MDVKLGRGGKFLSCSRYPDCDGALMIDGTEIKKDEPIGTDPTTGLPIYVLNGRFGPYVQLGEKMPKTKKGKKKVDSKKAKGKDTGEKEKADEAKTETPATKPKMASIPKGVNLSSITVADALKFLSVPRTLGTHPTTGKTVSASIGRFGPYVLHDGNYRSIKAPLNVYDITLEQALELLAQEKKPRGFAKKKKE
jgi:DNA topoisomerase-1